jgi:hypothetical protein
MSLLENQGRVILPVAFLELPDRFVHLEYIHILKKPG